jgi:acetyl-CoA synthetase/medium-chain acyl-CoA synthetase
LSGLFQKGERKLPDIMCFVRLILRYLNEHPAIAESAVVASPGEMRGEVVKAYVILALGYSASPELATELQEHVKQVTAPYKYPREIEFVESLPKTISGKIRRVELREREHARKTEQ